LNDVGEDAEAEERGEEDGSSQRGAVVKVIVEIWDLKID
jgi:hypothetical protein